MSDLLYSCPKRKVEISLNGYCDWFDKKKNTLTKKCCSNCRYLKDDKKTKKKNEIPKKTSEDETKT